MPKFTLGIDVGGSKIASALVDDNFRLSKARVMPTSQTDLLSQLTDLIASYQGFQAIALALPGSQIFPDGRVGKLPNITGFKPANVKIFFQKKFRVPVSIVNDAKAFALAEAVKGEGKNYKTVAGVVLGTGIGVGMVINKQIYFGRNRLAGEFGHIFMPGGEIFEKHVKRAGKFKTAKQAQKYLILLLNVIVRSFDPEIIVVGGGWGNLPGMQAVLERSLSKIYYSKLETKIKVSKLKHAAIIGAVLFALKK